MGTLGAAGGMTAIKSGGARLDEADVAHFQGRQIVQRLEDVRGRFHHVIIIPIERLVQAFLGHVRK